MVEYKGYNYSKEGNTYTVYNKEGKAWIVGFSTEEKAKEQIDDLVSQEENTVNEKKEIEKVKEELSITQDAVASLTEMFLNKEA